MDHRLKAFEADLPRLERELAARDQSNAVVLHGEEAAQVMATFRRALARTTAPGEDVRSYHDRQVVILTPGCGLHWLDLTTDQSMITAPSLPGTLTVARDYPPEAP